MENLLQAIYSLLCLRPQQVSAIINLPAGHRILISLKSVNDYPSVCRVLLTKTVFSIVIYPGRHVSKIKSITFYPTFILMSKYLFSGFLLMSLLSCNLSPETKKQLEKTGKEVVKQVKATVDHIDGVHDYIGFEAKPDSSNIRMYWKDDKGALLGSLQNLKNYVEQKGNTLLYACNGGMYMENRAPLGY
jgi:hypothetical protein